MRLETEFQPLEVTVAELNRAYAGADPVAVLARVLADHPGRAATVSSFGAESVVLLHLLAQVDKAAPVLFLDTEMLFPATLAYQREVAETLGLTGVQVIRPDRAAVFARDADGDLHRRDPDLCCALRKAEPLDNALRGYTAWITGRKRHQTKDRAALDVFEVDAAGRVKVNPLASWTTADVNAYIDLHGLPRHPLVREGFLSIGCAPCTTKVAPGEDARAGRWRGRDKDECGIHLVNGRFVRTGELELADER
jgi:phosphoadenosine phosphosulfate reductase